MGDASTADRNDSSTADEVVETNLGPTGMLAVGIGLYVAVVVAPVATLALGDAPAWQRYVSLLANGIFLVAVVAAALTRFERPLARRLGGTRLWLLLFVPPLSYPVWLFGHGTTERESAAVLLVMLGAFGGLFLALIVATMARNRHLGARFGGEPIRTLWTARTAPRRRRAITAAVVGCFVLGFAAIAVGITTEIGPVRWAGQLLPAAGASLYALVAERDYEIVDDGLLVRFPATIRLLEWADLDGFRVTGETLVIERSAPWRLDVRCDRGDIADFDSVTAALSEHLPER